MQADLPDCVRRRDLNAAGYVSQGERLLAQLLRLGRRG